MELLMQGVVLMVIGMATVFAFLVLMIIAMSCSAGFCRKFAHLFPEESESSTAPSGDAVAEIAVALAAIKAKRG
jgi:sodium pump decarboxylase gamma subunit